MPTISSEIEIKQNQHDVFWLAQDYGLRLEWDPFLRKMKFLHGAKEAATGVHVWVEAKNRLTMTVEYITLNAPHVVAMKMIDGPAIFEKFSGSWQFRRLTEDRTRVIFKYNFRVKYTFLAFLLNPLIKFIFLRDIRARLQGLKHSAEETDILSRLRAAC